MRKPNLSRRQFIKSLAVSTSALTVVHPLKSKAQFFNQFGYWKKPNSSAQSSTARSLRFRSSASAYLNRSFAGTPTTYTFSCWVKRGSLGSAQMIAGSRTSGVYTSDFGFDASDQLRLELYNSYVVTTTGKYYRDPTAWIHIVLNVTVSGAINVWVNNVLVGTGTATANSFLFNSTATQNVLGRLGDLTSQYFDGYLSRIAFVDGQALAPDSFGSTDTTINEWSSKTQAQIKTVVDAGGSNSFMLDFDDATFATYNVGKDFSSKGNHWTPNGFNVTTNGPTYDWMLDVPGNSYAVLNPNYRGSSSSPVPSNANLYQAAGGVGYNVITSSSIGVTSGKWYFELYPNSSYSIIGFETGARKAGDNLHPLSAGSYSYSYYGGNGQKCNNGSSSTYGSTYNSSNVIGAALDLDSGNLEFFRDNSSQGIAFTGLTGPFIAVVGAPDQYACGNVNFGQAPLHASATYQPNAGGFFRYTPPTGFKALCQANLPTPTIAKPNLHFDVKTYAGTGGVQTVGSTSFYNLTYPYSIGKSLRFNGSTQYLSRTIGTPTNARKLTISLWLKRCDSSSGRGIWGGLHFYTDNSLRFQHSGFQHFIGPTNYRDSSVWNHLVMSFDTDNGTSTERIKAWMNGVPLSNSATPGSNWDVLLNTSGSAISKIGRNEAWFSDSRDYFDGYMADVYLIDGQALTPTDFGQWDSTGSTWIPKAYSGTYGANGFYLNFSTGTSLTTLGNDNAPIAGTHTSANDWTLTNFTAGIPGNIGVTEMWMTDTPTNNFCTLNPNDGGSTVVLSNGNLSITTSTSTASTIGGTAWVTSGKWYWEMGVTSTTGDGSARGYFGIKKYKSDGTMAHWTYYGNNGDKYTNESGSVVNTAYGATYTTQTIGVAFDADNGTLTFYKDGVSQGIAFTGLTNGPYTVFYSDGSSTSGLVGWINFGQRSFNQSIPSGYSPFCNTNAPIPATTAWMPSLAIVKSRTNAYDWCWADNLRGPFMNMASNALAVEATNTNTVQKFFVGGIQVGNNNTTGASSNNYVSYLWKGGSPTTNTSGTLTSLVSANTSAGFSVVTYYSGASGDKTVGHGLGQVPKLIITKARDGNTFNWSVYHSGGTTTVLQWLRLNTSDSIQSNGTNAWGSSLPTTSVFGITSGNGVEANKYCVAYCFAEIDGYSKFGTYTGNGSADGPFVWCGFKPKFVMVKASNAISNWTAYDSIRDIYNPTIKALYTNTSDSEYTTGSLDVDILSNGFKFREGGGQGNDSSVTYIFIAFAEVPAKYSLGK